MKKDVEEFIHLNEASSKRLLIRPLVSSKPKEEHISSDDSDVKKDSNKKRRKKKAITRADVVSGSN
uniref:Uncharacterized protein n=1 Tax=Rhizophagus irregularis (strain DAOM 181602 / DAOM 197198 / MUCL 43194) TaxID=747089 RepID=U9TQ62_RHIID